MGLLHAVCHIAVNPLVGSRASIHNDLAGHTPFECYCVFRTLYPKRERNTGNETIGFALTAAALTDTRGGANVQKNEWGFVPPRPDSYNMPGQHAVESHS